MIQKSLFDQYGCLTPVGKLVYETLMVFLRKFFQRHHNPSALLALVIEAASDARASEILRRLQR